MTSCSEAERFLEPVVQLRRSIHREPEVGPPHAVETTCEVVTDLAPRELAAPVAG